MKPHTTNYANTFIEVAEDSRTVTGTVPPEKAVPTVARMQYDRLHANPYKYTSDDLIFEIHAERQGIRQGEREKCRKAFFSKGQACLRSSPLAKTYGWGIHHDGQSRVAIYPVDSQEYARLKADKSLKRVKAMRSAR